MNHDSIISKGGGSVFTRIPDASSFKVVFLITYPAGFVFAAVFLALFLKATFLKSSKE